MRNYNEGEKKLLRIFWILVFAIILFGYFVNKKYQEDAAEKERQYDKMLEVKLEMQRGVYPLEGEATAIRFDNFKDLSIIFLPDDDAAEDSFEKVGYTYQLEYISDEEYFLTAEVETKSERYDGDYAFQCKVKKSGEQYVLCELETDDAFPEFTTAKQLTDDEMDEFFERYRNATGSSAGNATGSSAGNDSGAGASNGSDTGASAAGAEDGSSIGNSDATYGSDTGNSDATYGDQIDPSDYDIEQYYLDYEDEFDDEEDAAEDFLDNPEYWDDY